MSFYPLGFGITVVIVMKSHVDTVKLCFAPLTFQKMKTKSISLILGIIITQTFAFDMLKFVGKDGLWIKLLITAYN